LAGLTDCSPYQVQVAAICSGVTGTYSAPTTFSTTCVTYCPATSNNPNLNYITNVSLGTLNNTSGATMYSDFTTNSALQPTLLLTNSYTLNIAFTLTGNALVSYSGMAAWIDFNKNGIFETSEKVLNMPVGNPTTLPLGSNSFSASFTPPSTALLNTPLRMRIVLAYATSANAGLSLGNDYACAAPFGNGEVEDYNVNIVSSLGTSEVGLQNGGVGIYPNPATDVLNVTKVSDKATYKIYSAAGQLVSSGVATNQKIDVSSLVKGVYVISISDKGSEVLNTKFIKK
jgi:hypothetical protein